MSTDPHVQGDLGEANRRVCISRLSGVKAYMNKLPRGDQVRADFKKYEPLIPRTFFSGWREDHFNIVCLSTIDTAVDTS